MVRSLLSRARRRSSCSDGGIEEPQQSRKRRAQLRAGDDRVEIAEAEVLLREAEVVRQLLPGELLDDPWPGERHERARLCKQDVPEGREAREDTAGRRVRH